jgi:hypothetical protein
MDNSSPKGLVWPSVLVIAQYVKEVPMSYKSLFIYSTLFLPLHPIYLQYLKYLDFTALPCYTFQ